MSRLAPITPLTWVPAGNYLAIYEDTILSHTGTPVRAVYGYVETLPTHEKARYRACVYGRSVQTILDCESLDTDVVHQFETFEQAAQFVEAAVRLEN